MNAAMPSLCQCRTVAETDDRFCDFAPYVPAVLENGDVLLSARTSAGKWHVFRLDGENVADAFTSTEVCSHPAFGGGVLAVYAAQSNSERIVLAGGDGAFKSIAHAGPLGPTLNANGVVAFRTELPGGLQQIGTFDGNARIHADSSQFSRFHGLPLAMTDGSVVFRADRHDGVYGIFRSVENGIVPIALTGERFNLLNNFPSALDDAVAFCATSLSGQSNAYIARDGVITPLLRDASAFESMRGVLIDSRGRVTFYATPASGEFVGKLAIFQTDGAQTDCLLAIGASMDDSIVDEFALNPVSINLAGRVAIRVKLENGKQKILVFDPIKQN